MRFVLIDRIDELQPGVRIRATKNLSLAEEYLADHFPGFPVMPGVLMLEAMTQAAAWLVRATDNFAHSVIVLREARNVKYGNFVEPGQVLSVTAEWAGSEGRQVKFKAQGALDGATNVTARLVLERYNLAEVLPNRAEADAVVLGRQRELFAQLCRRLAPQAVP